MKLCESTTIGSRVSAVVFDLSVKPLQLHVVLRWHGIEFASTHEGKPQLLLRYLSASLLCLSQSMSLLVSGCMLACYSLSHL